MAEEKQLDPLQSLIYNGGRMVGDIGEMIGDGVNAVQDGFNAAGEWVGDRVEDVQNGINAAGQAATDAGEAIVDTAGKGVDAVVDWGQGVGEYWGGMPALAQEGFDTGLTDDTTVIGDTVADAMEAMSGEKSLGSSNGTMLDNVAESVTGVASGVADKMHDFIDQRSGAEPAVSDPVAETVESARDHSVEMTM